MSVETVSVSSGSVLTSVHRQTGVGPVRTKQRPNPGAANARASKRLQPPKPKTAEELDKELDAFMKDEITADSVAAAGNGGDVEMS